MPEASTTNVEGLLDLVHRVRDYVNDVRIHAALFAALFADQPRYFRACSAMDMIEDTAGTIWRLERRGEFPKHHRISPNVVAWIEEDVHRWIEARVG